MNKEQIVAIIQRGYFTDGDLADALLAELAKVSEPVAWLQTSVEDGVDTVIARTYRPDKFNAEWWRFDPLYLHPLPQPDLVAENEHKEWALLMNADIELLRQQLSAAQASEYELLNALEKIAEDAKKDTCLASMHHLGRLAKGAIAAHKARKEQQNEH